MIRNVQLDNAKFILILLVVFGHAIELFKGVDATFDMIFKFIYSFHMPAFILIAGLLTKEARKSGEEEKLLKALIIPLMVFTVLYEIPNIILTGKPSEYTLSLSPFWILWFLFSLFSWRIISPYITKFKYSLGLSVGLTLVFGYFSNVGYFLSLSRTFYFLPFFLLGYMHSVEILENRFFKKTNITFPLLILILNLIFFCVFKDIDYKWLFGSMNYSGFELQPMWSGPIIRFGFLFLSFISSVSFIIIVSKSQQNYTTRGRNSLYVYLWHGFFIKALSVLKIVELLSDTVPNFVIVLILFIISMMITVICSSDIVKRYTEKYLFAPVSKVLLTQNR